jgi:hypothetical protein
MRAADPRWALSAYRSRLAELWLVEKSSLGTVLVADCIGQTTAGHDAVPSAMPALLAKRRQESTHGESYLGAAREVLFLSDPGFIKTMLLAGRFLRRAQSSPIAILSS